MKQNDQTLKFVKIGEAYRALLPIFGAHPLSNVYKEKPVLIVEGEDDERIWQQAIRSGAGRIEFFRCPVEGLPKLNEYERDANEILQSVYDDAFGFSLRDRDANPELIDDFGRIKRMRLACRAAENLMLSDDVLVRVGTNWASLKENLLAWTQNQNNREHQYYTHMKRFADEGFDRKGADLKEIRIIILGAISGKPWEFLVGQAIGALARGDGLAGPNSLKDYLGTKVCEQLLHLPMQA
jgi:hypothetical protein